ncbi:MAG: DUF72 domain-containing protein [Planctomycetota bacterium]|nr:DUF72 domain-containing protein [Planctomycetota bacterium]
MSRWTHDVTGIGVAGWSYADWEGPVYPREKGRHFHPLRYLARYIDCMEVNSSFYAVPNPVHVARWVELVAEHEAFRFIVKLHRGFTHEPVHDGWMDESVAFQAAIEPLVKAGLLLALLVQFPVTFQRSPQGLERLARIRRLFPDATLCVELRHRSWFEPATYERLRVLRMGLVHIDLPAATDHPPATHPTLGSLAYLRLHGRNEGTWFDSRAHRDAKYDYLYSPDELTEVARRLVRIAEGAERSVVITNNHYRGQAVANALELKHLLTGAKPPAPETLRLAYPELAAVTRPEGQQFLF